MMDCRQALEILEFDRPDMDGLPDEICSAAEHAAALAHVESCPTCARTVQNRRELDRAIGNVMRSVALPRGAQQRLLAQIAELEAADANAPSDATRAWNAQASDGISVSANSRSAAEEMPAVSLAKPLGRPTRRRFLKSLSLATACAAVALGGFFGVVWYFLPSVSVAEVSKELADLDPASLHALPSFPGSGPAALLPKEAGWENLKWQCDKQAKGLPLAPNLIAVYGFELPPTRQAESIPGLIAVIPRNRVRNPPLETALTTAVPTDGYITARIGESVCVAWQDSGYVYVCLVRGGPDSLSKLQRILEQPSA